MVAKLNVVTPLRDSWRTRALIYVVFTRFVRKPAITKQGMSDCKGNPSKRAQFQQTSLRLFVRRGSKLKPLFHHKTMSHPTSGRSFIVLLLDGYQAIILIKNTIVNYNNHWSYAIKHSNSVRTSANSFQPNTVSRGYRVFPPQRTTLNV